MPSMTRATTALATLLVAASLSLVPSASHAAVSVFPVPTSAAGLQRIVTAPGGDMWFVMRDANKIGRITTDGVIKEFTLPAEPDEDPDYTVMDLDIADDGTVWVVHDSGRRALAVDSATIDTTPTGTAYELGVYPYGGQVRVGPDGIPFVTMNYDESGVARILPTGAVWPANAPECEDVLGEAADGTMWCQGGGLDQLVRINADAAGGTAYPLPSDATYPQGIAAGPVGSIWFTRSSAPTMFTSPSRGSIGYLDAGTGATTIWQTGSRSAPRDLVRAPDGTMWFTNRGAAPGIGHIDANGVGAITSVGNYEPTSLTWGADGAVWFTDAKNNSIVRVTTDQLQTTNVDLGTGVTMKSPAAPPTPTPTPTPTSAPDPLPPPPGATGLPTGSIRKPRGTVKVKGKVPVRISCPTTATAGCNGTLRVLERKSKRQLSRPARYRVASGDTTTVRTKLSRRGTKQLRPGRKVKVILTLTAVGETRPASTRTIKVRRAR